MIRTTMLATKFVSVTLRYFTGRDIEPVARKLHCC